MTIDPTATRLPNDILDGQLGVPREVVAWLNDKSAKRATATSGELHLYVDGTNGDDNNDGLTKLTPKQTLSAIEAMLPFLIQHDTVVHMRGSFSEFGIQRFIHFVLPDNKLIFDGGDEVTTVAGPFTADTSSTSTIGDTGQTWTEDQYRGYWVRILSGAQTGVMKLIHSNTTGGVLTTQQNWTDPGNAQFDIVRPTTEITASSTTTIFEFQPKGDGIAQLQRVSFRGSKSAFQAQWSGRCQLASVVFETTRDTAINCGNLLNFYFDRRPYDPDDPANFIAGFEIGVGFTSGAGPIWMLGVLNLATMYAVLNDVEYKNCILQGIMWGSAIRSLSLYNCRSFFDAESKGYLYTIYNSSGYRVTEIRGSAGVGLLLIDSSISIDGGVSITGNTGNGIELVRSRAHLEEVVGSNSGGFGCYAHSNSVVHIANGKAPTIDGATGDLSFDGSTEVSTWANLDAGTPVNLPAECTMAKEV